MKHSYIANETEAANMHAGRQTAIVTLVKHDISEVPHYPCTYFLNGDPISIEDIIKNYAPYQPSQTIAVRESWMDLSDYCKVLPNCNRYGYRAEADENQRKEIIFYSPVTMPREAVRTHLLVKDVLCARVQDITSEHAQAIWPDMTNIERMQDLHRKFGGDAWANNAFIFITIIEKQ